jgi:hypothetical protein
MDAQDPSNLKKRILLTGVVAIFVGFGFFLHACENRGAKKERQVMEVTQTNAMPDVAIPSIDRSAPLKTETATFALG